MNTDDTFFSRKIDFDFHTEVSHDMWLYPLYIKYLMNKNEEDYSGDEIYVWNLYKSDQTDWMPFMENTRFLKKVTYFGLALIRLMTSLEPLMIWRMRLWSLVIHLGSLLRR